MKKIISAALIICLTVILISCGNKEITIPDLDNKLSVGTNKLDYSTYEENDDEIKVTLAYNQEILIVGIVQAIRNTVEMDLGKKYKKIDLTIIQEKPEYKTVNYIYDNGKWDKDIE